jgi:hypothetical protein
MSARTLSFTLNGVDKGVAFKELPMETLFPAACLYYKVRVSSCSALLMEKRRNYYEYKEAEKSVCS